MWLLVAVLVLLGSSEVIAGLDDHVLPPVARWGWWTLTLLGCGLASIHAPFGRFHQKAMGLVSVTMFYTSYPLLWDTYVGMIPAEPADFPWTTVFLTVNVILPLILVTIGPLLPVIRVERE